MFQYWNELTCGPMHQWDQSGLDLEDLKLKIPVVPNTRIHDNAQVSHVNVVTWGLCTWLMILFWSNLDDWWSSELGDCIGIFNFRLWRSKTKYPSGVACELLKQNLIIMHKSYVWM